MAGDLAPKVRNVPQPDSVELFRARPPEPPSVLRGRFVLAYLVLAVVAGIGIGAAVVLVDRPDSAPDAAWSSWKPSGHESSYPRQVADYVTGRYRLPSGEPMVLILANPPQVQDVPIRNIAIRNDPADQGDISIIGIDPDKSVMYTLCGGGAQCTIPDDQPTPERRALLRREALELALYTLKYADIEAVIVTLPPETAQPGGEQATGTALFFQRKDLARELREPLSRTLLVSERPGVEIVSIEGPTIERLTRSRLYGFVFTQAQEGSAIMILAPIQ